MLNSGQTGVGWVPGLPGGAWVEVSVGRWGILPVDDVKSIIRVAVFIRDRELRLGLDIVLGVLHVLMIIAGGVVQGLVCLLFGSVLFLLFPLSPTTGTREVGGGERARAVSHDGSSE